MVMTFSRPKSDRPGEALALEEARAIFPKLSILAKLNLNRPAIWWMSANFQGAARIPVRAVRGWEALGAAVPAHLAAAGVPYTREAVNPRATPLAH